MMEPYMMLLKKEKKENQSTTKILGDTTLYAYTSLRLKIIAYSYSISNFKIIIKVLFIV
ncbi:hypothetical protein PGB90_003619 [Kerria lacca]